MTATVTRIATPTGVRPLDAIDLLIADAMLLAAHGPNSGALSVARDGATTTVTVSAAGRSALLAATLATSDDTLDSWVSLLAPALVEEVVDLVGEPWRAEIELGVELQLALRADAMTGFALASVAGPVRVDVTRDAATLLADDVLAAALPIVLA